MSSGGGGGGGVGDGDVLTAEELFERWVREPGDELVAWRDVRRGCGTWVCD